MALQVSYTKMYPSEGAVSLCAIRCVRKSPVCVDTDTRRHHVEFVLVPFCRIFFNLYFFRTGERNPGPLYHKEMQISLFLSLSVFCCRSAVTGRADCWRRAVWALFSTHTHNMPSHNIPTHIVCTYVNFVWYFTPVTSEHKYICHTHEFNRTQTLRIH